MSHLMFLKNYLDKLPGYLRGGNDFHSGFCHRDLHLGLVGPSIVCAAGPSLDASIEKLKNLDLSGFWIFACDAASKDLVEAGINPHFIVCSDGGPGVDRFHVPCDAVLLHEASSRSEFARMFPRSVTFHLSHSISIYLHDYIFGQRAIPVYGYGSVLNCAVSIAVASGSHNIYLCGADLSFTRNRSHCRSWATDAYAEVIMPGADRHYDTSCLFLAYAKWLESYISSPHVTSRGAQVINCSEDSILNIPRSDLESSVSQYVAPPQKTAEVWSPEVKCDIISDRIRSIIKDLQSFRMGHRSEVQCVHEAIRFGSGYKDDPEKVKETVGVLLDAFYRFYQESLRHGNAEPAEC